MDSVTCGTLGTLGNVLPGSLLGPIVGLTFSTDGILLFACSGSFLWVYDVSSGALLSTVRVFMPGVAVYGMDVGRESFGAIFGEKCVRVVDAVPTGADTATAAAAAAAATSAWFQGVVYLPDLDDRVWDARLVDSQQRQGGEAEFARGSSTAGDMGRQEGGNQAPPCQEGKREEDGRHRGTRAGMGLLAVALAHNLVEVWDWASEARPLRVLRTRGGDPCLLYHARLWGRTLDELRVAAGTVFNQVLVWNPGPVSTNESIGDSPGLDTRGREGGRTDVLPARDFGVLRLKGHEGVIFRVAWREDGRRLVSASDDRTVRVWDVECNVGGDGTSEGEGKTNEGKTKEGNVCGGRLLWTGWGHASRVWDVVFTRVGVVTCGEDGTAILWREDEPGNEAADTAAETSAARTVSTMPTSAASTPPSATAPRPKLHSRRDEGQLVPVATMRGHSGANTWRLAVHEFDSLSSGSSSSSSSSSGKLSSAAARKSRREERECGSRGLTLMATGGNDGTCKLWDLDFEGACERRQLRQLRENRRSGTMWGQTEQIPHNQDIAGPVSPDTALIGDKSCATDTHEDGHPATAASTTTHGPLAASSATRAADRNETCSKTVAAAARGEPKGNPTEPEPSSNASSSRNASQEQTSGCSKQDETGGQGQGQGQSRGRASRRRGTRQRQKKPAVVREVKLAPPSHTGTSVAAAVLLADGCVWWVPDLQEGTRERVTVSVGDAAVADGATQGGLLSSAGISAVAVVGLSPGEHHATDKENTPASDRGGESVAGKAHRGGCGSGGEFAIVAGRDDGWLSLLSQNRPCPTADPDGRKGDQPPSQHRAWRISAAWKGHRSRVTAVWAVRDAVQGRTPRAPAGGSQAFTAALETSRLSRRRSGGRFDGALVSAGADGTVAWWEWACSEEGRNVMHTGKSGSGSEEMRMPAPRLRMVCQAGPGAVVTSVAIDDRRQPCHRSRSSPKINHGGGGKHAFTSPPDEIEGSKERPSAGAVVFCGDTKGGIHCFLEEPRSEGRIDGVRDAEVPAAGRVSGGLRGALQPCLVLRRQHGKDQVSRIALRGECLFSAGHDGQVNHYAVSYSVSSPGMLDASGECALPSSTEPIGLAIVTTYATAPVTTVSELWVGGEGTWEAGPTRASGGSSGQVRLAVAGRSASSRMSVWDLTEGRQILELECGEKHLAQDLVLSWPSFDDESGCSGSELDIGKDQGKNPSTVSVSKTADGNMHDKDKDGNSIAGRASRLEPPEATLSGGGDALAPPALVLPRHAFVFAEPTSSRGGTNISGKNNDNTAGKEVTTGAGGSSCPENNNGPPAVLGGDVREHRQQQKEGERQQRPGLALAFHSSFFPAMRRRGDQPGVPPQQEQPCASKLQAAAEKVADSPTAGLGSASVTASTVAVAANQPTAAASRTTRKEDAEGVAASKDDRNHLPCHLKGVRRGGLETSDYGGRGGPVSRLPGRFGYSLGKPFHSQRVASVKFIIPGAPTARLEAGQEGLPSVLRLITGGEDGAVKLLDVFYERLRRSSNSQADTDPAGDAFYQPYAKVVQTLPSHESSVGALAVGMYGLGSDADETECFKGLGSTFFVSGGGKMEARAWCMEGGCGKGLTDAGGPCEEAVEATCAPPVRWLATTTPAPKSPLHGHRILSLCILPPSTPRPRPPSAHDNCRGTIFVAGDSGGGVTVFELLQRDDAAVGGIAGGGKRESWSRPAGRWMTSGERPVLSLAHARVPTSAAPDTAVDFVATGDTVGTVTVWEFLPGGGSGVLASFGEGSLREGAPDVRGGFVYRGPAGKRRGGNGMSGEGVAGGEPPPRPGLVPVLSYRAHQMGVLCMTVHVPPEGGRMVIVTGGDDQAVCVAEVELHDYSMKPSDEASLQEGETSCVDDESPGKRRFAIRLVAGGPEVTNGAAGSAIKGISVVPVNSPVSLGSFPSAKARVSPGVDQHPYAGERTRRPSIALSVFTISRDQRLSRWDLVEENKPGSCAAVGGTDGPHPCDSRICADGAEGSSSLDLDDGSDHGRRRPDVGGTASMHDQASMSHQDSDGLRQKRTRQKKEGRRRWRLRWRAGCVTDVTDVSGLDVYPLPGGQQEHDAGETAACCTQGASTKEGAISEGCCGRSATGGTHASPAALVAVSGQGLQLVLFRAY